MDELTAAPPLMPEEVQEAVRSSLWASMGAMALTAFGPMFCYLPYFVALPLGAWGAWQGWQVSQSAERNSHDHRLSQIALISGLMSTGISGLFVVTMLFVVAIYAMMFFVMIFAGVAGSL